MSDPRLCDLTHLADRPCHECGGTAVQGFRLRFKLSPELVDGQHWAVVDSMAEVQEAVGWWCDAMLGCATAGESFTVETVLMTDAEVEALPDL